MSTEPSNIIKKSKPHYTGHRQRVRERFLIGGADEMSEHYYRITKKTDWWKKVPTKNTNLSESKIDLHISLCWNK